jgi:tRNA uridine 5-carboxymethylaminomethyl modification enzyme
MRLTPLAHEVGLVDDERYAQLVEKQAMRDRLIDFAREYSVKAGSIDALLEEVGSTPMKQGQKLIDLVKRPQLTIEVLSKHIPALAEIVDAFPANRREEIVEAAEVLLKYEGYIERERQIADKIKRLERITIDRRFDYNTIKTLSTEARQKLSKIRPETIAQASRIPGVSPSDINILLLMMGR